MKGSGQGNHNAKPKLPPHEKSQRVQFRLDPKDADDAWALDARSSEKQKNGWDDQELFKQGLQALGNPRPNTEVPITSRDIRSIHETLEWIVQQIQSENWVMSEKETKRRGKKDQRIDIADFMQPSVERYVDEGIVAEDDDE